MAKPNGPFVVFEGIDGAGTTTQVSRYAEYLTKRSRLVHATRQPSTGPIGCMLRQVMSGRLQCATNHHAAMMGLLFAADRLDHLANEVDPYLRDGAVVLCDRYDLSSLAYQSASAGPDVDPEHTVWLAETNRYARRPDLTLIFTVDPAEAARRRGGRTGMPEIYEQEDLQIKLAGIYAQAELLVPKDRLVYIDANASLDVVFAAVCVALDPLTLGS